MDHWQTDKTSLKERTSFILSNDLLSDVRFTVGPTNTEYPAHKLLLSLASPVFEKRFSEAKSEDVIRVPDIVPSAFYKMLQYIYTDTLVLDDQNDASNLLALAEKFQISHLETLCKNFIQSREIPPERACKMYDAASKLQMNDVLKHCLSTFKKHTQQVLKSNGFLEAQLSTVEAIVQINTLAADEITIIENVLKWGIAECRRKKLDPVGENIRFCISPLMKHLRFLSLSTNEFCSLFTKYDIFTKNELFLITMQLSQPGGKVSFPPSICQIMSKRNTLCLPESCAIPESVINQSKKVECPQSPKFISEDSFCCEKSLISETECSKSAKISTSISLTESYVHNTFKEVAKLHNEVISVSAKYSHTYDIPLHPNSEVLSGFKIGDVSSVLKLKVWRGRIQIVGLTLNFRDQQYDMYEPLQIVVHLSSPKGDSLEEQHNMKANNKISIFFKHSYDISPLETATLKVIIESLPLQMCLVSPHHEFFCVNYDSRFDVVLSSNQRIINSQMPFFISQILYNIL